MQLHAVDIKNAFVKVDRPTNGEDVYMHIDAATVKILVEIKPEYKRFVLTDGTMVVKIIKALYGMLDSGKLFYDDLVSCLRSTGFKQSGDDQCLWKLNLEGHTTILAVHIDGILAVTPRPQDYEFVRNALINRYKEIKEHSGKMLSYLGMNINMNKSNWTIDQNGLTEELFKKHDINQGCKTPPRYWPKATAEEVDKELCKRYRSLLMSLFYIARLTRHDILHHISALSTFSASPQIGHMTALMTILHYLYETKDFKINIHAEQDINMVCYVDASWASHRDGKSHSGMVIKMGRTTICAYSRKQQLLGKSSAEAELIAISDFIPVISCCRDVIIFITDCDVVPLIMEDNAAVIGLLTQDYHAKQRHITVRYEYIKKSVKNKDLKIQYLNTKEIIADILTKPLGGELFSRLRSQLLG